VAINDRFGVGPAAFRVLPYLLPRALGLSQGLDLKVTCELVNL
jgi:hypothetical protein